MGEEEETSTEGYSLKKEEDEEESKENETSQEEVLIPLPYLISEKEENLKNTFKRGYSLLEEMLRFCFPYLTVKNKNSEKI